MTAERRTVNLQKTNISATVLSGAELEAKGVNFVDQLQFIAPDVTVDDFGEGVDFDIRGIGKGEHNSQTPPGVITYRDGVPTFPGYVTEEPYYDVANIQLLRGPQGTFAGENAIGGAVFVTTQNPVIGGGYDGYIQGQYGNYSDVGLQGATNLPIDDTLAARFAFYGENRGSFYDITTPGGGKFPSNPGDRHWGAGRFSLLWKPDNHLTVLWKTDVGYFDNGAYPADPYSDRFQYYPGTTTPNPYYAPNLYKIVANSAQMAEDQEIRSSVKIDYVLPDGITLRSVSGYQWGNTAGKEDLYGAINAQGVIPTNQSAATTWSFVDNVDASLYTQEFNVISPDTGMITWVVGTFAQYLGYNYLPPADKNFVIAVPAGSPYTEYTLQGKNPELDLSGFGQASVKLPEGFELQLGGRYIAESTKNDGFVDQYGTYINTTEKATYYNASYKVALNWNLDDTNFLYGFLATGFKPGGLNVPVTPGVLPPPFGAETSFDYEAGWKSSFFDGHLRTQLDGFYDYYKNFQVTIGYPLLPTFGFEVNDPNTTRLYGFEGETQAVFGALSFDANVGIMHSQLGTFYATDPRISTYTACNTQTGPASASCIDLSGHEQTYAPNFTANFGAQYQFNLDGGDTLTPRVDFAHVSTQWATLFENAALGDKLGVRNILNAQLAWNHDTWIVALYGMNLTNDQYVAALNSNLDFAGQPRQYGIRLTKAF